MISWRIIICLGTAQLISWGTSYYLIGVFGDHIVAATGWSRAFTYGGFSLGLMAMAIASPWVGLLMDQCDGRLVLTAGSLLNALGCAVLAWTCHPAAYYLAWIILGFSMRFTLYDAAFAVLARSDGIGARRAMAQITLFGGLASTTFWPLGNALIEWIDWRGALLTYAAISLAAVPLYLASSQRQSTYLTGTACPETSQTVEYHWTAGWLYAAIMSLVAFLNSGMSAHMIGMLQGLGLGASAAVWVASLRGIGQTAARGCDVLFGRQLSPATLNMVAALLLVLGFVLFPVVGVGIGQAILFVLAFGAGNGLMSITRGTVPLIFVRTEGYGSATGRLLAPSFVLSATAPIVLSFVIEMYGPSAAVLISLAAALIILGLALVLRWQLHGTGRMR